MKKIKSLFERDFGGPRDGLVRDNVTPGAEWVIHGDGVATRKWDGTCCKVEDGVLWKRHDRKLTKIAHRRKKAGYDGPWNIEDYKPAPAGWVEAEAAPDSLSGHWPGWVPVGDGPEDQWHRKALANYGSTPADGTYELCGPKIGVNAEHFEQHELIRHGKRELLGVLRSFDGLCIYFEKIATDVEGVVWHHPDGRMVKVKAADFGLERRR